MWTRKDAVSMTLAAVATFGVTVALFLPRVVNATNAQDQAKVLSPVLHIGQGDECRAALAMSDKQPAATGSKTAPNRPMPGQIIAEAGPAPVVTFLVNNPSDQEATISFTASFDTSRPAGRSLSRPQNQWTQSYDLVLKPGESRELAADTKATLAMGARHNTLAFPFMRHLSDAKSSIQALSFSVPMTQQQRSAQAFGAPINAGNNVQVGNTVPVKAVQQVSLRAFDPAAQAG